MYKRQDLYTEFVSRDYEPEDPERRLWKWVYNDSYDEEYAKSDPHPTTGDKRYLIPIEELIEVEVKQEVKQKEILFEPLPDANADVPFNAMTLRDYAAIQWKLPVSHKAWLNNLINDKDINAEIAALNRLTKGDNVSQDVTTRLRYMIQEVDGNGDRGFINKFVVNGLLALDTRSLRSFIKNISPDMDMKFDFTSDITGDTEALDIPFGIGFFYPSE